MSEPLLVPQAEKLLVETEIKVPNAYPLDPERQKITDEALRRPYGGATAPLFVSWLRPDGARFSATIVGGFVKAEAYAAAVQRFESPLVVRIGRFAYEGLPPKVPGFVPASPILPNEEELKQLVLPLASRETPSEAVVDRGVGTPDHAEGTSPKAPTAEAPPRH